MLIKEIFSLTLAISVIYIAIVAYNEQNFQIESEFSYNLQDWFSKGNYFGYNGHKLFYVYEKLDEDTRENPVVVLMHGFPTSSYDYLRIWNQFINEEETLNQLEFKPRRNSILTFDYLGYGFSDKPANYSYSIFDMADMVEKLVLHLNIESVVLVAHDISDTVAQEILRRDNQKKQNHYQVKKCILMNGGIMTSIYQPVLSQYVMRNQYLGPIVFSKYLFRFNYIYKFSFRKLFGEFRQPNNTELYDFFLGIKYNEGNERLPETSGYMQEREEWGNIWYDALNDTSLPVLFIYGPADPINPRNKFPAKLRSDLPRVKLSILSDLVGHYPHFEDSFTVYQLIKNFI